MKSTNTIKDAIMHSQYGFPIGFDGDKSVEIKINTSCKICGEYFEENNDYYKIASGICNGCSAKLK